MNTENKKIAEIALSEEVAKGIYSNLAFIAHSSSEFVVDFAQMLPGMPKPTVKSRIILTAEHAKRLLKNSNLNITDIAFDCGFNSSSQFTNIFKKYVSLTPKEYRNKKNSLLG